MHLWSFHVSSNIPMECGWSSDIGYNIVFVWCSLSFDISIRAEVSTLRKVVMRTQVTSKNHWWDVPVNEYCTQKYRSCEFVTIFWQRFFLTQSYNQINTSSEPKEQSRISTLRHLSGAEKNQPSLQQVRLVTDSPSPWKTGKKTGLRLKEPIKKETIRCASLQIGFDVCPLVGR